MSGPSAALSDKRIIVVGGAGLLGCRICSAIIEAGGQCIIADISPESAEAAADSIAKTRGARPSICAVSIIDEQSVDSMIAACSSKFGRIDGLVNAAYPRGKNYGAKFEDVKYADFCENVNLHLGGCFLVSQRILEYFKRNGGGSLVNIASVYGIVAPRFGIYAGTSMTMPCEYAAIKAGLIHLSKYMAKYYSGFGIRVNCVSPGGILDGQPPSFVGAYRAYCDGKGMLDPNDVVGSIVFLLSDAARFIDGQNIVVDDGFTL
jgi:NAD(P)-dependent dehydrogenase (short-subunit alcohol dehydrogenase family)